MPTYEYKCEQCGMLIEVNHSMNEEPVVECPQCNKKAKKVITGGSGFILKSSGSPHSKNAMGSRCGKEQTCCGSLTPCETRPCDR